MHRFAAGLLILLAACSPAAEVKGALEDIAREARAGNLLFVERHLAFDTLCSQLAGAFADDQSDAEMSAAQIDSVREAMEELSCTQTRRAVRDGKIAAALSVEDSTVIGGLMILAWAGLWPEHALGIDSVQVEDDLGMASIPVRQPILDTTVAVTVRLRDDPEVGWRVIGFEDLSQHMSRLRALRAPYLDSIRSYDQARLDSMVEILSVRPVGPDMRIPGTPYEMLNVAVRVRNGTEDVIASAWVDIDLLDEDGHVRGDEFTIVSDLPAGGVTVDTLLILERSNTALGYFLSRVAEGEETIEFRPKLRSVRRGDPVRREGVRTEWGNVLWSEIEEASG